jgi:hypothetical protein
MNYQTQIYKINDNLYIYNWFNFLKIEYNKQLSENTNFVTSYKRNKLDYNDGDKTLEETINKFPYTLLNIDFANELLYKNENNEWYLLKYGSYDTNDFTRCQQGEYKEYKIELSNEVGDLVMKRNLLEKFKYENIYDDNYINIRTYRKLEKIEPNKDYNDPILNILFSNKFPLYFYPSREHIIKNNILDICIPITMIELEGNEKKVIIKYNNKEYYYSHIHFYWCCGSGTDSFIQLDSRSDMEYFDYDLFENDDKMQKYFEYLRE